MVDSQGQATTESRRRCLLTEPLVPNILTSISGMPKTGKTYLALTYPEPIKVYSFDRGCDYIRKRYFATKEIDIHNYTLPIIESDSPTPYAEKIWEEFQMEYREDAYGGHYKTLVIDTATAIWGIIRQAITEAKNRKRLLEVEYALPNLKMGALFAHASEAGVNLVTIQYLRDKYVKGENTGEIELDGWKNTAGASDVVVEMTTKIIAGDTTMVTTIKANRFDRNFNGQSFVDTTYDELIALLFGG